MPVRYGVGPAPPSRRAHLREPTALSQFRGDRAPGIGGNALGLPAFPARLRPVPCAGAYPGSDSSPAAA